jgi:hypothetical protein
VRYVLKTILLAGMLSMLIAGCGSGASDTRPDHSEATSQTAPPTSSPLAAEITRLEEAGYRIEAQEVTGAQASIEAGGVSIYSYASSHEAEVDGRQIQRVYDTHPRRGMVAVHGNRLYSMGKERPLSDAERARFQRVMDIAEGELSSQESD